MKKVIYHDVQFGIRNGQPNAVPSDLVIGHGKLADYVLNFLQSPHGVAVMAIPRDGRPLREWAEEERTSFLEEALKTFGKLWLHLPRTRSELLLNQGVDVGQSVPYPHMHCFMGYDSHLLNWGREGFPPTISPVPFTGQLPQEGQYHLYHRYDDKRKGEWTLIPRGSSPRKEDNPKRENLFPIIVDGKLLPEWERKILLYRRRFYDSFG